MLALAIATVLIVVASCGLVVLLRAIWQSVLDEPRAPYSPPAHREQGGNRTRQNAAKDGKP